MLAGEIVSIDESLALANDAIEAYVVSEQFVLLKYRDFAYSRSEVAVRPGVVIVDSGVHSSTIASEILVSNDFVANIDQVLKDSHELLGVPEQTDRAGLVSAFRRLPKKNPRARAALCLTYGESVRRELAGRWCGLLHGDRIEPVIVTQSHGVIHFCAPLLKNLKGSFVSTEILIQLAARA